MKVQYRQLLGKRQYGLLGNHYPKDRQCQWRIPNDNNLYNSRWEKRKKINSKGKKLSHKGTKKDKAAKVYKLVPDSGSNQTVNLWVESDTTVVILDDQMNTPAKPEHYRLKTVKNKK